MAVFTDRQRVILATLRNCGGWVTGRDLAESAGTSRRTLQTDIKSINLAAGHPLISSNNRLGYCLADEIPEFSTPQTVVPQGQCSTAKALLLVLLFESDYLHIEELADRLFISRSTVNAHLAQARRIVARNREARLVVSPRRGLWIGAREDTKRLFCAKLMNEDLDYAALLRMPRMAGLSQLEKELQQALPRIFLAENILISGQAFQYFTRFLAISITRSRLGMVMPEAAEARESSPFVCELNRQVGLRTGYQFSAAEQELIRQRIHELNLIAKYPVRDKEILRALSGFEKNLQQQLGIPLRFRPELRRNLGDHLKRMCRRILSRHNNVGQYTKEMFTAYPLAVHLIKTCLEPLLGIEIPDSEMDCLVMYVASAMEELGKKMDILLVSNASPAVLYTIQQKIRRMDEGQIGRIEVLPRYAYEEDRQRYLDRNRIYLTTEPALSLQTPDFLVLSVFPSAIQLGQVRRAIEAQSQQQRRERQDAMARRYPVKKEPGGCAFYEQELLPRLGAGQRNLSAVTVGDNLLCVIEHGTGGGCELRYFTMEAPLYYRGKRITSLLYAAYRGGEEPMPFFAYLRAVLRKALR